MLKLPYGIRDFDKLITGNYVYCDRTGLIPFMEEWGYELLFLRPRRFGKSLWLSTLMAYYDLTKADDFERLFGHLEIGQNPTPLHNQYLVMRWDFSAIKSHGSVEAIEQDLNARINQWIRTFQQEYQDYMNDPSDIDPHNALVSLDSLVNAIRLSGHQLYLFIDEYDNFANEVMMGSQGGNSQRYLDLVQGEGMYKTFFKNLKFFGSGAGLDRVFVTGVSPIVMNDLTSGPNTFEDIYWFQELNGLCGFYESEVVDLVQSVLNERGILEDELHTKQREALDMMRTFYNGSWFTTEVAPPQQSDRAEPARYHLYNPTLVFYFLRYLQRTGKYPPEMLDRNLQSDRGKLVYLASYNMGRELLVKAINGEEPLSVFQVGTEFGVEELWEDDVAQDRLASLLCYLGALTVNGTADDGKILLKIPNLVVRKLYAERIVQMTFEDKTILKAGQVAADELFRHGQLQPLCDFIQANLMSIYSNRDYPQFKELSLKTLFITLLYHNTLYVMDSEPELTRRYGDLLMLIRPGKRNYKIVDLLFEFKQLSLKDLAEQENGTTKKYTGAEIEAKSRDELISIPAVRTALDDAKKQLRGYQQTLLKKYGDGLKLRTFAVVGVSLERIIWEQVDSKL